MTAQFWLRRAVQVAPTPVLRRSAIQNYRAVAVANPWTLWLQFGITPSSNVNNGSVSETLEIGDIDFVLNPDAQALSGIESTIGLSLGYRLTGLGGLPARLGLSATLQDISLSPDARDAAPDIDGDAFDYAGVELRLDQALSRAEAPLRFRVDARLGRTWYGGSEYASYVRAGVGADWGDPVERITSVTLSAERQERLDLDSRSATILRLEAVKGWRLPSGDDLLVAGTLRFTSSDSIEIDHDAALASVTYDFGTVAGGQLALATSIGLEWRHYDDSPYRAGGRDDLRKRLSARVGFPRAETYGFIPEITFEASEVTSNVSLYESRDFGVRLGFRSSF